MDKEKERRHLDSFKSIYKDFPTGSIIPCESPDFIVRTNDSAIGIEHTQIYKNPESHGSSLQAQEKLRLNLIQSTKSVYDDSCGPSISAYFIFNEDGKIFKNQLPSLSNYFANEIMSSVGDSFDLKELSFVDNYPQEQDVVHFILVERRTIVGESNFSHVSMGWTKDIGPSRLIDEISRKEDQIESYKQKCTEIWLLIVAEDFTNASSMSLSSEAKTQKYITCFDKVFFYWHFQPNFVELSTTENNCS